MAIDICICIRLEQMLPYFFIYLAQINQLPVEVLQQFQQGNCVVMGSDDRFNQVDPDHSQEWLDGARKRAGGIVVRCLSGLNVNFSKKSPKLAQMTFDRYLSNPDIGRTFWGGLTPSN